MYHYNPFGICDLNSLEVWKCCSSCVVVLLSPSALLSPVFQEWRMHRTVGLTVILKISNYIEVPMEIHHVIIRLFAIIRLFSTLVNPEEGM